MSARKLFALFLTGALLWVPGIPGASAEEGHSAGDRTVKNRKDGTKIAITVFKPAGAGPSSPVPVILHSHGWGGSRTKTVSGVIEEFLDAGFGVVSIDQRGHGESDGPAHIQDPTRETEDIKAVVDFVAKLRWVQHDRDRRGNVRPKDPVLGAIGGSYGGGYQTMTALDEIADQGRTRFNAIAPEITWYDLPESLAPQKVARSAWDTVLYAAGARMLPQYVHEGFAWGSATGQWPDGTLYGERVDGVPDLDRELHKHGPVWFVEKGVKIDVPVLLRQGTSDNLFNLNEGIKIFQRAVTKKARKKSLFVAYNGGHALPNALPAGTASGDDACSPGNFTKLTIKFFKKAFAGKNTKGLMPARYNMTTADGDKCLRLARLGRSKPRRVKPLGPGGVISTAGAGAPLHIPIAEGPMKLAGIPKLRGRITTTALDSRSFFGLSIGSSPADALVIQNNVLPLRRITPGQDRRFKISLPGVVAKVPKGKSLFLTVTPVSDLSFGHGSRMPGAVVLRNVKIRLPRTSGGRGR